MKGGGFGFGWEHHSKSQSYTFSHKNLISFPIEKKNKIKSLCPFFEGETLSSGSPSVITGDSPLWFPVLDLKTNISLSGRGGGHQAFSFIFHSAQQPQVPFNIL